jgi:8-oxo-dGTP diphosphatase
MTAKKMVPNIKRHEHTRVAADVVIFTVKNEELKVLLIKMKKEPYLGYWAAPGGIINPDESVEEAARRHLCDKTGVDNVYLEQLYTFGSLDRDPFGRVVSVAYFALIPSEGIDLKTSTDYDDVAWFGVHGLPKLAYDHLQMINHALQRLQSKLGYTNVVYSLLPERFTLTELQKMYELILQRKLDKRNFRRKFLSLGLAEKVVGEKLSGAHRPAQLFKFKKRSAQVVELI